MEDPGWRSFMRGAQLLPRLPDTLSPFLSRAFRMASRAQSLDTTRDSDLQLVSVQLRFQQKERERVIRRTIHEIDRTVVLDWMEKCKLGIFGRHAICAPMVVVDSGQGESVRARSPARWS